MDPEANRREQISLAKSITRDYDNDFTLNEDDAARLAELVLALFEWQKRGGF